MDVLMPTFEYDFIRTGGLSAALTSIAENMTEYANPRIILPRSGFTPPWERVDRTRYKHVLMEEFRCRGITIYVLSNERLDHPEVYPEPKNEKTPPKIDEFGKRIRDVADDIDFDLVHMHDSFGYKAMDKFKEMRKPILLTIHRLHREFPSWFKTEIVAMDKADYITLVGKSYYQEDEKEFFSRWKGKVTHVFNGIDTKFWSVKNCSYPDLPRGERRKKILRKYGLGNGVFYLYVGRFDPSQKGVEILLGAGEKFLKDGKEVRMIIVGMGDKKLEEWARKFERKHHSRVRVITELLPKEETRDLYCAADFVLVPSLFEPFGLVQLEAMSCGCIPIGSRTGGIQDTVVPYPQERATGFLVRKGSVRALLQTMEKSSELYRKNPALIEQLRRNGRERCETVFRWENSCREYAKLYEKLSMGLKENP